MSSSPTTSDGGTKVSSVSLPECAEQPEVSYCLGDVRRDVQNNALLHTESQWKAAVGAVNFVATRAGRTTNADIHKPRHARFRVAYRGDTRERALRK